MNGPPLAVVTRSAPSVSLSNNEVNERNRMGAQWCTSGAGTRPRTSPRERLLRTDGRPIGVETRAPSRGNTLIGPDAVTWRTSFGADNRTSPGS